MKSVTGLCGHSPAPKRDLGYSNCETTTSTLTGNQMAINRISSTFNSTRKWRFKRLRFKLGTYSRWIFLSHSFKLDETYTPNEVSIRSGTTFNDLIEVKKLSFNKAEGWISVQLSEDDEFLRTNFLQIAILSMHLGTNLPRRIKLIVGGRDTHVRQVKVYGPRYPVSSVLKIPSFSSVDFTMYNTIRWRLFTDSILILRLICLSDGLFHGIDFRGPSTRFSCDAWISSQWTLNCIPSLIFREEVNWLMLQASRGHNSSLNSLMLYRPKLDISGTG